MKLNLEKSNILVPFYRSISPEKVKLVDLLTLYLRLNANFKRSDIFKINKTELIKNLKYFKLKNIIFIWLLHKLFLYFILLIENINLNF